MGGITWKFQFFDQNQEYFSSLIKILISELGDFREIDNSSVDDHCVIVADKDELKREIREAKQHH